MSKNLRASTPADTPTGPACPEGGDGAAARLVFHGELSGLVRRPHRTPEVNYPVDRRASLKDVLESLGPPHTEVHDLRVDGRQAYFEDLIEPGTRIDAYPAAPPVDVRKPAPLRAPFRRIAFVVDQNVARLAGLLRLAGLDAIHDPAWSDTDMARIAHDEERILLSRDTALLKRSLVVHGRLIRAADPWDQFREVLDFYETGPREFLTRCPRCNGILAAVAKQNVINELLPKTRLYYDDFHRCNECGRIYWRGSHVERLLQRLSRMGLEAMLEKHDKSL